MPSAAIWRAIVARTVAGEPAIVAPPLTASSCGRQQLYERYYSGDPVRLAAGLYNMYDRYRDRIAATLDDLDARQNTAGAAPAFKPKRRL